MCVHADKLLSQHEASHFMLTVPEPDVTVSQTIHYQHQYTCNSTFYWLLCF